MYVVSVYMCVTFVGLIEAQASRQALSEDQERKGFCHLQIYLP